MADAPDNIDDLRRDLGRAIKLIADKRDDYETAQAVYDGTQAEVADSRAAETIVRQTKRTPLSLAHIPVDVISDKIELGSITTTAAAPAATLERWTDLNDVDDESSDWIRKACIYGDYYVVTDPTRETDDGALVVEGIDSIGMSPLSTVVVYDRKTGRTAQFGAHVWDASSDSQKLTKAVLYYDNCSISLVAQRGDIDSGDDFDYDIPLDVDGVPGDASDAIVEHPGGHMLIAHLAVGSKPYGIPVHRKAYGPQEALTKISANNLVNVDALGLPSRWALMDPDAEIDDDIDDDFGTDGPDTLAANSDGRTSATTGKRVRVVPGAVQYLRGVASTGTYEGAQADPFLANMDWYVRAMAVACGIALFEFDMNGEQPSGESRRRAEGRANRTAAKIKRQATSFFREIADTVLGLVGQVADVQITFNPSETSTDKDGLELVSIKVKTGVPLRQALLEAGYTDTQVGEWYPKDAAAVSPEVLAIIATALAQLGNAKTLGAISEADIMRMLPDVITVAAQIEGQIDTTAPEPEAAPFA